MTRLLQGSQLLHVFFAAWWVFFDLRRDVALEEFVLEYVEVLKDEVVTATYFNGKSCGNLLGDYNLKIIFGVHNYAA